PEFRGAIISACCGERSICHGDLCKCHVVANSLLDRLGLARQLADLVRHRHCHVERSEKSLVLFLLPAMKRQSEMFRFAQHDKQGALAARRATCRSLIVPESDRYYGFKWLLGF